MQRCCLLPMMPTYVVVSLASDCWSCPWRFWSDEIKAASVLMCQTKSSVEGLLYVCTAPSCTTRRKPLLTRTAPIRTRLAWLALPIAIVLRVLPSPYTPERRRERRGVSWRVFRRGVSWRVLRVPAGRVPCAVGTILSLSDHCTFLPLSLSL